jgi:hypothetical protein
MLARKTTGDGGPMANPKTATSDVRQFPAAAMPIGEDHRFAEAARSLAQLNSEVAALQATVQKLQGAAWLRSQAEEGLSGQEAIDQAQRLLHGEAVELSDASTKIHEAQQRLAILQLAAREQARRLELIRGEASAAAGERVKVRHRKALLDILRAARLLGLASSAERAIRNELLEGGCQVLDAFTPAPRFAIPLILGEERHSGSAFWHFAQQLEELGIKS